MGSIRKLRRNVARHPLQLWRAKQKEKSQNENEPKQEEVTSPSTSPESGDVISGNRPEQATGLASE